MNTGAFGEGFPYSNFHDLNMDWIIKIAKDFLDQYTHIQDIIEQGKTDIQNLTEDGLTQLQEKADTLESLLQAWYNQHSQDIADQLADALSELNTWYNEHQDYLDQTLADNILAFNTSAEQKTAQSIASIPADYTELASTVTGLIKYTHIDKADEFNNDGASAIAFSGIINSSNKWANVDNTASHRIFPVNPGDIVSITANSNTGTVYAVLSEYTIVVNADTPVFSSQSGFTTRLTMLKSETVTFTVPSDGYFLYVTYGISPTINFPAKISINGYDALTGIRKLIADINTVADSALTFIGNITEGTLDTYTTKGIWSIATNISNIQNVPYTGTHRATLIVLPVATGGKPHQIIHTADDGNIYQRILIDGSWTPWTSIITPLLPPLTYIPSGTDFDTILDPFLYFIQRAGTYTNSPFDGVTDRGYLLVIHPNGSNTHTLQIAIDGVNGNTYQRIYFDNTFTQWSPTNVNKIIGSFEEYKAVDHGGFFDRNTHLNYQNSPRAFAEASHQGIKYHNIDICFTSDGVPVVHHDNQFTDYNGVPVTISETTLSALEAHRAGDSSYNWKIQTLAECCQMLKSMGGIPDMVDISVSDPTNVPLLGAYYATHNINPTWTNCNDRADTTRFINANHDKYGVYLVCDTDSEIDSAIAYIQTHNTYGTRFMLNLHSSGSDMPNVNSKIKSIVDAGVEKIYCHLYKANYIDTIGIPEWADGILSETDNIPMELYKSTIGMTH